MMPSGDVSAGKLVSAGVASCVGRFALLTLGLVRANIETVCGQEIDCVQNTLSLYCCAELRVPTASESSSNPRLLVSGSDMFAR